MGDRNYYPNQYNPFMGQNYGYSQFQQAPMSMSYYPNPSPQGGGFTVNTSMPVYNTGAPSNQGQNLAPTNFSSDYGSRLDYSFSQRGFANRGNRKNFGWQNRGRPRDGGSFQGRGSYRGAEGVMSGFEDFAGDRNMDFEEQEQGSDDEDKDGGEGDNRALKVKKVNGYIPDPTLVTKYEYYPPSPEEMGEMFKDLVIHFFFKLPKNKKEQNPFVVICQAFRSSAGYCSIDVEDGVGVKRKDRKFCTLRYRGVMLVRGVGENNCIKEARVLAAVELINKLAMSCYTLESKDFDVETLKEMQEQGSVQFTFAPKEEVHDYDSARKYLQLMFSKEDSDVEYVFHLPNKDADKLNRLGEKHKPKFEVRTIEDGLAGAYRQRTPQYWRDKILASGSMETDKFILKPPQGIGNLLLPNFDLRDAVVQLRAGPPHPTGPKLNTLKTMYGPPGVGPNVKKALPPWERKWGSQRNKKSQQKQQRIMEQVKKGVPLTEVKAFKYLSKNKQKIMKKKLAK